jgi:deoxyribose-phosphate aldolase
MSDFSKYIEHTLLKPDCSLIDIKKVCEEAIKFGFAGVCIPPLYMRDAKRILGDLSPIRLSTVVGFPMGYSSIASKSEEIKRAVDEGADDIDAVANIAAIKNGNWNHVSNDIESMIRATHMRGRQFKLILECGLLTDDEIKQLAQLGIDLGATYLKTGTGFHGFPATVEMVSNLKKISQGKIKIKAAGGIRTLADAKRLVDAGADLIGTSSGVKIISESNPN